MIQREGNRHGYVSHRMAHRARRLHFRATHIPAAKVSRSLSLFPPHRHPRGLSLAPFSPRISSRKVFQRRCSGECSAKNVDSRFRERERDRPSRARALISLNEPARESPDSVRASNSRVMYTGPRDRSTAWRTLASASRCDSRTVARTATMTFALSLSQRNSSISLITAFRFSSLHLDFSFSSFSLLLSLSLSLHI